MKTNFAEIRVLSSQNIAELSATLMALVEQNIAEMLVIFRLKKRNFTTTVATFRLSQMKIIIAQVKVQPDEISRP